MGGREGGEATRELCAAPLPIPQLRGRTRGIEIGGSGGGGRAWMRCTALRK